MGGNDIIKGGAGNDVINDGHSLSAAGLPTSSWAATARTSSSPGTTSRRSSAAPATTSSTATKPNLPETGNEGDDWIETGHPGRRARRQLRARSWLDDVPGNDVFLGDGGFDEFIGEGGDDILVGSAAQDKMDGMSGFDWVTYKDDRSASPST